MKCNHIDAGIDDDLVNIRNQNANSSIFDGNTNGYDKIINTFAEPVIARMFSLHPLTWHNQVSLRWELIGCGKMMSLYNIFVIL